MVFFRQVLITLLMPLLLGGFSHAQREKCRECHDIRHYAPTPCAGCHRGNPLSGRKEIAHYRLVKAEYALPPGKNNRSVAEGAGLMKTLGCRRCHVSGGAGNRLAASLDAAAAGTPELLERSIRSPVAGMPDFRLSHNDAAALVRTIMQQAPVPVPVKDGASPRIIHLNAQQKKQDDIFTTKCGGCHSFLSRKHGLLGQGRTAPNLSGFGTEFYFTSFRGSESWDGERLREWLKNPRSSRRDAMMRPVELTDPELKELLVILVSEVQPLNRQGFSR